MVLLKTFVLKGHEPWHEVSKVKDSGYMPPGDILVLVDHLYS